MLCDHIGEKTFLRAVFVYLRDHLYRNAEAKDLWKALSDTTGNKWSCFRRLNVTDANLDQV